MSLGLTHRNSVAKAPEEPLMTERRPDSVENITNTRNRHHRAIRHALNTLPDVRMSP
jgi:hypothetical protein